MPAKKPEMVKFEYEGNAFEAVKSEMDSYETNKQLAVGGPLLYIAMERLFNGRDVEYSKVVGGSYDAMIGLVNAAFAAYPKAKN